MAQEADSLEVVQQRPSAQAVQVVFQFLRMVRYRKKVILCMLLLTGLSGAFVYLTATRYYQSTASLMLLQTGNDVTNTSIAADGAAQGLMPTYQQLFSMAVVLEGAIDHIDPVHRVDFHGVGERGWPAVIRRNLSVNTVRGTNIIDVGYRSKDPESAAAVINAVLKSYLEYMDRTHRGTSNEIIQLLSEQKDQLEKELFAKESELLAARQATGDLSLSSTTGVSALPPVLATAISLSAGVNKAREKRMQLQATLSSLEGAIARGEDLQPFLMTLQVSLGRDLLMDSLGLGTRSSGAETNIQRFIMNDEAELEAVSQYLGPKHPKVVQLRERIEKSRQYLDVQPELRAAQLQTAKSEHLGPVLANILQQQVSQAWHEEQALMQNFEVAKAEAIGMHGELARIETLTHEVQRLRSLADVLVNQIASVDLRQDHGTVRTAIVNEPQVSSKPVSPKLATIVFLSVSAGLGIGVALAYVMDVLDDRFRSPEDLRDQLGVPVLSMIRPLEERHALGFEAMQMYVAPESQESEAFRTLRTTLAFSQQGATRIVFSSAEPGDGKTTVLANLAISYSQAGLKTLLIDADLRRPGLTNVLSLKNLKGLTDLLGANQDIREMVGDHVISTVVDGLDVIPAGIRCNNPAELLSRTRLAELLTWAEGVYDQILIDCPPVLAASDAVIVGRLVDGIAMVVQPQKNRRRLVMRAVEGIFAMNVNVVGVVLNRVSVDSGGGDYGYGYGYGYGADEEDEFEGADQDEALAAAYEEFEAQEFADQDLTEQDTAEDRFTTSKFAASRTLDTRSTLEASSEEDLEEATEDFIQPLNLPASTTEKPFPGIVPRRVA